ncbi:MAG: HepT-like ribonuclease domain-containing protein [Candidatus Bathyarchaeia archaeon]
MCEQVADHILASKYRIYPETYEDSLRMMYQKGVISEALYKKLKGLGGFRNVLVHEYLSIDLEEVYKNKNYKESLQVFTEFAKEILESDVLKGD